MKFNIFDHMIYHMSWSHYLLITCNGYAYMTWSGDHLDDCMNGFTVRVHEQEHHHKAIIFYSYVSRRPHAYVLTFFGKNKKLEHAQ